MYTYFIHGLNIVSPFPLLPQTQELLGDTDIKLHLLNKRPQLKKTQAYHILKNVEHESQASLHLHEDGTLAFEYFDAGLFLYANKTLFVVRENEDHDFFLAILTTQVLPLLSSLFRLTLHGGVVSHRRNAIAFLAPESSGKSTLTGYLRTKGLSILSDDVAAIDTLKKGALVYNGLPEIRLHKDSFIKIFGQEPSEKKLAKYKMDAPQPLAFSTRLQAIFLLNPHESEKQDCSLLATNEAFSEILKNQFRWNLWSKQHLQENFSAATHICSYIPMYKISYPFRYTSLDWIEQHFLRVLDASQKNIYSP